MLKLLNILHHLQNLAISDIYKIMTKIVRNGKSNDISNIIVVTVFTSVPGHTPVHFLIYYYH